MVQAVPVSAPKLPEAEFKNVWVTEKAKIEKYMMAVNYGDEVAVDESVLLQTAVENPEPAAAEEPAAAPAAEEQPAPEKPAAAPIENVEAPAEVPAEENKKDDVAAVAEPAVAACTVAAAGDDLKAEYEKLKSDNLTLQSKNAHLQSRIEELQKKVDAGSSVDRADRRSWIMLLSSIIILLAVVIYSLSRPSSSTQHKEL